MIKQQYERTKTIRVEMTVFVFFFVFLISCIYCICQLPVKRKRQQFFITVQSCHL